MDTVQKLTSAKIGLLFRHPFFGTIATRLTLKESNSWLPTAATDGRHIYYNSSFIEGLSTKQVEFLIAHEIFHAILDHLGRVGNRNKMLANVAMDFAVNQLLVDNGIGEFIEGGCLDEKYREMPWEAIYDDLMKNASENGNGDLKTLDVHLEPSSCGGDGSNKGEQNGQPTLSEADLEEIREEIKSAVISASQACSRQNLPSCIRDIVDELTVPKVNWKDVIRSRIKSLINSDYSFHRPSRRGFQSGIIFPGMIKGDRVDLTISIDTSGSIGTEDIRAFLSEIKGIVSQFRDFKIHLWCFDTSVHNSVVIEQENEHDLDSYEIKGGGGTDFSVNWDYMKENDITPELFLMFTDGCVMGNDWGDPNYCDTIFLVKDNQKAKSPFGETITYENC